MWIFFDIVNQKPVIGYVGKFVPWAHHCTWFPDAWLQKDGLSFGFVVHYDDAAADITGISAINSGKDFIEFVNEDAKIDEDDKDQRIRWVWFSRMHIERWIEISSSSGQEERTGTKTTSSGSGREVSISNWDESDVVDLCKICSLLKDDTADEGASGQPNGKRAQT